MMEYMLLKQEGISAKNIRNARIVKIIGHMILRSMIQIENTNLKMEYNKDCRTPAEQMRVEFEKPIMDKLNLFGGAVKTNTTERKSGIKMDKNNSRTTLLPTERDIQKIVYFLKEMPGLTNFIKFNGLGEEHLRLASNYFQFMSVKKGTYLFKQGDLHENFYGLLQGKISLRIKKIENYLNNNFGNYSIPLASKKYRNNNDIDEETKTNIIKKRSKYISQNTFTNKLSKNENNAEQEVMVLSDGMCFGEWAMMYNIPRTASAFVAEDAYLFFVTRVGFDAIFSRGILKKDNEKKNFIISKIPFLKSMSQVHDLLKNIVPVFCKNKSIIYTEFDSAEYIYLVYQGECKLTKFHLNRPANNADEIIKNKEKLLNFLKIIQGGLVGLEIIYDNTTYNFNLLSNSDETILYKINRKFLKDCYNNIEELFKPILDFQIKRFQTFWHTYSALAKKVLPPLPLELNSEIKENYISKNINSSFKINKVRLSPIRTFNTQCQISKYLTTDENGKGKSNIKGDNFKELNLINYNKQYATPLANKNFTLPNSYSNICTEENEKSLNNFEKFEGEICENSKSEELIKQTVINNSDIFEDNDILSILKTEKLIANPSKGPVNNINSERVFKTRLKNFESHWSQSSLFKEIKKSYKENAKNNHKLPRQIRNKMNASTDEPKNYSHNFLKYSINLNKKVDVSNFITGTFKLPLISAVKKEKR